MLNLKLGEAKDYFSGIKMKQNLYANNMLQNMLL